MPLANEAAAFSFKNGNPFLNVSNWASICPSVIPFAANKALSSAVNISITFF